MATLRSQHDHELNAINLNRGPHHLGLHPGVWVANELEVLTCAAAGVRIHVPSTHLLPNVIMYICILASSIHVTDLFLPVVQSPSVNSSHTIGVSCFSVRVNSLDFSGKKIQAQLKNRPETTEDNLGHRFFSQSTNPQEMLDSGKCKYTCTRNCICY